MLRRSPLGILVSLIVVVIAVVFGISRALHNVDTARSGIRQATGGSTGTSASSDDSLVRSANFTRALDAVKGKDGTQVLELRLEPGEARFQVRDGDAAKGWSYRSGGDLSDFRVKLIGPGRIEDNVFPISRLSAGTPERIVAGIHAENPSYDLGDVQFMTLDIDPASGQPVWSVNIGEPGSGNLYQADLDGSNVRAPGESGANTADCIANAAGDPARIQACVG